MRKGIAVPTILKLVLGVLVVVIVIFLIYKYVLRAPLGKQACKAEIIGWCSQCQLVEFKGGLKMGDELCDCAKEHWSSEFGGCNADTQCDDYDDECAGFLPTA